MRLEWYTGYRREWFDMFVGVIEPYRRVRWVRIGNLVVRWGDHVGGVGP